MGLHMDQGKVLLEALSQSNYEHLDCPSRLRENCENVSDTLLAKMELYGWHQDEIDGLCKWNNEYLLFASESFYA